MDLYVILMEFRILLVSLLISLLQKCDAQGAVAAPMPGGGKGQGGGAEGGGASLVPSVCRKDANGTSLSVEIRLPFMDMELNHESRVHVLQDQQLLLVLHGHELFQWHIGSQDKRLVRLGQLEGRVRQQLSVAAAVVLWHEDLLLAVALKDTLEFYQLPQEQLLNSSQWHLHPIQEFSLPGPLQQLHLLKTKLDQVVLLLALNSTQTQSKVITFEWLETYFNPVGELNLPPMEAFQVVGRQPHYVITGRSLRSQTALVLSVYELETPSLRLRRRQSLTVHARHVLAARFRGRNHLIACGKNATAACLLFRMVDGNFVVYRKHMLRQLHFGQLKATELGQLLIGARVNGDVLVFNSHRLDCYSGFGGEPNPSGVFTHRNPQNETFLLLAYQRQVGTTLLRMVQLVAANDATNFDGNDDLSSVQQHRHEFEETINELRSLLLRQKQQVDALRRLTQSSQEFTQPKQLHLRQGGYVEQVHLQRKHLQSPTQLKQRMEQLHQQYAVNRRQVRSFGVGNDSTSAGQELLKVRRLHVQNLIYNGELMPGYYLDTTNSPILTIKGQLSTKTLHTQQLLAPQGYERPSRSVEPLEQSEHLVVQHLTVARINNVSWFDFYDSLFLHSRDNLIEGRLIVQSRARIVNLETPLLNGLVVQQLFNLRQPQIVSSNIFMSAFFVSKLDARLINGLDFANDIVFRNDKETLIKSPVHIYQMSVSGDLLVANNTKWKRQMMAEDNAGTGHRLQQYYTGRVILNGSLTVNNVKRDTNATVLQLGDQSLRRETLHSDYLLLQGEQNLTALIFGNAKLTTPVLNSAQIHGHPIAEHLLNVPGDQINQKIENKKPLHIIFMDAKIEGDVYSTNYSSRLAELSKDAVRQGETATITGYKQFEAPLTVENISSRALNGIDVSDLVLKSQSSQHFTNPKIFGRIVVKHNVEIVDNLVVQGLNSLAMEQLLQPGYSLQRLELPETPKLQQLNFQRFNGQPFDELLGKLSVGESQSQLLLHKQLIIEGNVKFERELQLETINDIQWDDYTMRLVNANANTMIRGKKSFQEQVVLTDALQTPSINGLDLSALLDNTLLRSTPQSIGGSYTFDRMTVGNLDVPGINGVPANSFLHTRQGEWRLEGDLYVNQLTINGSLNCNLINDPLPHLDAQLATLQQRAWPKIYVLGDALWPEEKEGEYTRLDYLRQHAVRRGGVTQVITGHVVLQQPQLGSIETPPRFPGNLNLSHIAQDALLRRAPFTQLIESPQEMLQAVRARTISLHNDCHFEQLNHIDPIRLNASLYRISSRLPIGGPLRFMLPPNVAQLQVRGQLNGGHIDGIFEQSPDVEWPAIQMRQLQVQQQLQLNEINGMSLQYLLQHRVPLRGDTALEIFGTLTFEDLVLGERAMLRTINGIPLQNVVYKHSERLQSISGAKTFEKGIDLLGPVHMMHLNGKDLTDSYQQSIFTDRDYSIDSLVLDGAAFEGGLLRGETRFRSIGESRQAQSSPGQELRQQLQQLEKQLRISQEKHSKRLLYLDYEQHLFETSWNAVAPEDDQVSDLEAVIMPEQSSICQLKKKLRAQLFRSQQRVYLSNVSTADPQMRISSTRGTIRVKAHNNCNKSDKFRSRIHINCRGQVHNLGMRQHVEDLQLHEQLRYSLLMISTLDEVRVLRVNDSNCSLSDWQSIQPAAGRILRLIQVNPDTLILLSSALHEHLPAVAVHRLSVENQRFEQLQLIEGDYDLVELQDQQLILSCYRCHRIDIHIYSSLMQRFQPLQQLRLEARIQQLLPFVVGNERHLLVLTMGGSTNFYLLSYTHIGGWQQRTYGHMGEVLWSWPLLQSGSILTTTTPLLLLCGERHCSLVKALLD
ncbi:uncharacterized protein LOC117793965 [Drosophila innubila]|uniref:uncharacterized protein LOC117793965 n=1 Tax=Drosophila innubila TaxID=198719 RepID=UPI00148D38C5|nr:uncharacterized protein LOC117793965 [Drosophila innubila]